MSSSRSKVLCILLVIRRIYIVYFLLRIHVVHLLITHVRIHHRHVKHVVESLIKVPIVIVVLLVLFAIVLVISSSVASILIVVITRIWFTSSQFLFSLIHKREIHKNWILFIGFFEDFQHNLASLFKNLFFLSKKIQFPIQFECRRVIL